MSEIDSYGRSRVCYILEAAFAYFVSIMVSGNYLAYLASAIGIEKSTVGVLTSFVSLGCGFQVLALLIKRGSRVKRIVVLFNLISQLAFVGLYVVPFFHLSIATKTAIFVVLLLAANLLLNVSSAPKANMTRKLIPPTKLGKYAVLCEMVSLISGMVFTFVMGLISDYYKEIGNLNGFFIVGGVTIGVLALLNIISLVLIKEIPDSGEAAEAVPLRIQLKDTLTDKTTLWLIPLFALWNFALYGTTSFLPEYAQSTLGFSMTVISVQSAAYAILRSVSSFPLAAVGDKRSFPAMMTIGMGAFCLGLVFITIGGEVNYWIYYMLYAVTLAGTNSSKLNIIFTYVPPKNRSGAIAILFAIGGFAGFLGSLSMKPLYDYIYERGSFLGIENIHPVQVISTIGILLVLITVLYLNLIVKRLRRVKLS